MSWHQFWAIRPPRVAHFPFLLLVVLRCLQLPLFIFFIDHLDRKTGQTVQHSFTPTQRLPFDQTLLAVFCWHGRVQSFSHSSARAPIRLLLEVQQTELLSVAYFCRKPLCNATSNIQHFHAPFSYNDCVLGETRSFLRSPSFRSTLGSDNPRHVFQASCLIAKRCGSTKTLQANFMPDSTDQAFETLSDASAH